MDVKFYVLTCISVLSVILNVPCLCCDIGNGAIYNMVVHTLWSEDRFPKDYPMNRPKAQWSQAFGQSHNSSYTLYRIGEEAREAVRKFSQFGTVQSLIEEGDDEPKVYDLFTTSALGNGTGDTENVVFVEGGFSLVSMVMRMIPSPDWFIGVDSVNLCVDSSWVDEITLDLEPLDAGAASGLTFTAPRWETTPPAVVTRHEPKTPNHPAAGFYYPELKVLPPIAKVQFIKIKEYTTKDLNDLARKEFKNKLLGSKNKKKGSSRMRDSHIKDIPTYHMFIGDETEEVTANNNFPDLKNLEQDPIPILKQEEQKKSVLVLSQAPKVITTTLEPEFGQDLNNLDDVILAVAHGRRMGQGKHLPRHFRSRLHHAVNRLTSDDCLVSDWSDWTPCSVTCGFGDRFRTRHILRQPTNNGRECPPLQDRTHCGNVNSCLEMEYFDW